MYKKFLMLSLVFILSLSSNAVFAGDAEKGKKLFKKCAACHKQVSCRTYTVRSVDTCIILFCSEINREL